MSAKPPVSLPVKPAALLQIRDVSMLNNQEQLDKQFKIACNHHYRQFYLLKIGGMEQKVPKFRFARCLTETGQKLRKEWSQL